MKLVIDEFESEEDCVAFAAWLKNNIPTLFTTKGVRCIEWDGVDLGSSDKDKLVINICTYQQDDDEDDEE